MSKIGDVVTIRSLEKMKKETTCNEIGGFCKATKELSVSEEMRQYCGQEARITEITPPENDDDDYYYKLDVDGGVWYWESWMFEED